MSHLLLPTDRDVFSTAQLNELGVHSRKITQLLESRVLYRVERGIFTTQPPVGLVLLRALMVNRPGLVFSGLTAYQLYFDKNLTLPVQAVVVKPHRVQSTTVLSVALTRNTSHYKLEGLRVSTPVVTAIDLVDSHPAQAFHLVEKLYRGVQGKTRFSRDIAQVGRLSPEAKSFVDRAAVGADSRTEVNLFRVLKNRGVNLEQNRKIGNYRWDGVIERERVAVEVDGHEYHTGENRDTFIKDRWKRNEAVRAGYAVLTYSEKCIDHHITEVVEQIIDTVRWRSRASNRPPPPVPLRWEGQPVWAWHEWWREPAMHDLEGIFGGSG